MDAPKPPKPNLLRRSIAGIFIDLQGLPVSLKILTIAGYLAVFGLLFFTLLVELAGDRLPMVEYSLVEPTMKVPLVVMAIAGLAFILGWAYLLTGASAARARIFLPVLVLFALQLFMVTSLLGFFLELLFLIAVLIIYGLTFRTPFWYDLPGLYFFGWLGAVSVIVLLSVGTSATNSEVAGALSTNFTMVMLLTLVFWVLLGFSTIDLGIKTGRFFTRIARKFLPFPTFSALIVFVLVIHPAVSLLVVWLSREPFSSPDLVISILLIPSALVVWITRRWSASTAAVFLALSLAAPVVSVGLYMAFAGKDFTELLLKMTGLFPPTLLFVGLTTYNLFGMGVVFTSVNGRILPKRARLLLYFGTLLLVVACMLFMTNERFAETNLVSQDFQQLTNSLFAVSAFFLGVPYVVWMIWKRRELLIGPEKDSSDPPRWAWLGRVPGSAWIVLSLILACACACVLGGILIWLAYPRN
ncbi:MAG: hypothetical protein NTV38_08750 [Chloroflexi bacterium]|nr:hypothetical protein [Chloroflexota bacterium]